jgi:hypothetical protein
VELKGADELRARMVALVDAFGPIAFRWAKEDLARSRQRVHSPRGNLRRSFNGRATSRAGLVFADYRVTFQEKGTRPHGPKRARVMSWKDAGGKSIFARHVRGVRKRPFLRRAAREALQSTPMAEEVIKAWNSGRGKKAGKYVLGDIEARKRRYRKKVT